MDWKNLHRGVPKRTEPFTPESPPRLRNRPHRRREHAGLGEELYRWFNFRSPYLPQPPLSQLLPLPGSQGSVSGCVDSEVLSTWKQQLRDWHSGRNQHSDLWDTQPPPRPGEADSLVTAPSPQGQEVRRFSGETPWPLVTVSWPVSLQLTCCPVVSNEAA